MCQQSPFIPEPSFWLYFVHQRNDKLARRRGMDRDSPPSFFFELQIRHLMPRITVYSR
jgi:hypothetical protein